jgi:tetratricopeptide (TPR) repeat protein
MRPRRSPELEEGVRAFNEGRLPQALLAFDKALRADRRDAHARFFKAMALGALGNTSEALESMEAASNLEPRRADWRLQKAFLLEKAGRVADAAREFREAARLDNRSSDAKRHAARLAQVLAPPPREAAAGKKGAPAAAASAPRDESEQALVRAADAHERAGRHAEALAAFDQALALRPREARLWESSARVLMALGDNAGARARCRRALSAQPGRWSTMQMVASIERQGGDVGASLRTLRRALPLVLRAIKKGPRDAFLELDAAEIYEDLAELGPSLKYLKRAYAVDKNNLRAREKLGQIYLWLGRWVEAARWAKAASALDRSSEPGRRVAAAAVIFRRGSWRSLRGAAWKAVLKELALEPLNQPLRKRVARELSLKERELLPPSFAQPKA